MELTRQERQVLSQLARELRDDYGALEVRLFGSAVRGELEAESDVDIYVVMPDLNWPLEQVICDRCYEATLACGRLIAPSVFSANELANTAMRASPFVRTVQQEGLTL